MSYTPTNWKSGDVVTSAKLNKMEQGIADSSGSSESAVEIIDVNVVDEVPTLNKTAGEILQILNSGKLVFFGGIVPETTMLTFGFLAECNLDETSPSFTFIVSGAGIVSSMTFKASSINDYPVLDLQL